jgi:hypothetical protein
VWQHLVRFHQLFHWKGFHFALNIEGNSMVSLPSLFQQVFQGKLQQIGACAGLVDRHHYKKQYSAPPQSNSGSSSGSSSGNNTGNSSSGGSGGINSSSSNPVAASSSSSAVSGLKAIMKELKRELPAQLDLSARAAMFVRFDEEQPQFLQALLTGVAGSPYESGCFLFDVYVPPDYPATNPLVTHKTKNAAMVHANNCPGGYIQPKHAPRLGKSVPLSSWDLGTSYLRALVLNSPSFSGDLIPVVQSAVVALERSETHHNLLLLFLLSAISNLGRSSLGGWEVKPVPSPCVDPLDDSGRAAPLLHG